MTNPPLTLHHSPVSLEEGFTNPPDQSRPGVWWRWIDANISKEGITRDLSEMARKGVRHAQIFDVSGAAKVGTAGMMTPEWRDLFKFAVQEATRLGITLAVVPAAGWGTGGPWIKAEHAAKVLRYSEIQVDGPRHLSVSLPKAHGPEGWHRDVAVVAFRERADRPVQPAEVEASSVHASYYGIERNWPPVDATDGDPNTHWKTAGAPSAENPAWIQLRYHEPLTVHSLHIAGTPEGGPKECELQASEDGQEFRKIFSFKLSGGEAKRIMFAPTTAPVFRLVIYSAHHPNVQLQDFWLLRSGDNPPQKPPIKWWWFKSGNRSFWEYPKQGPAALDEEYTEDGAFDCRSNETLDLSSKMSADGKLEWDVPAGRWTIARFGTILLDDSVKVMSRATKGPAYEADPLSPKAADQMFDNTAKILLEDAGKLGGKTLSGIIVDSWEYGAGSKGMQPTWTDDFRERFQKEHGYDLLSYLPALARRIVDSREKTNRFFWDYRKIMADAYLDFYGRLTERANQGGMFSTAECGYGTYPFQHIDGLAAFGRVDMPMAEFWYNDHVMRQHFFFCDSVRTAASSAHTYGKNLVSAETLTAANGLHQTPDEWKSTLDREFANGLNFPVMSVFSHQNDVDARPGVFTFESINDNMTWWEMSQGFLSYMARCQFLLQQGVPVADACYFFGEDSCKFVPAKEFLQPPLPQGCEFDGINAEVILNRLFVKDRLLVLPNEIFYRYLVLPATGGWKATSKTLRKIAELVDAGATIIGPKPSAAPGLKNYPTQNNEVSELANALWGDGDSASSSIRPVGRGRVISGMTLAEVMARDGLAVDLDPRNMAQPQEIQWCHRRTDEAEIYFISNQSQSPQNGSIRFRVTGSEAQIWNPVNGQICKVRSTEKKGSTEIAIGLAENGSIFVLFRKSAIREMSSTDSLPPIAVPHSTLPIESPWIVTFDPRWGGPSEPVEFRALEDWTQRQEDKIRCYSGIATYKTTFDFPESSLPVPPSSLFLDLGSVKNMAQVRLNGQDLGVVWTAPWRVNIDKALRCGENTLEIDVANVWLNRLRIDAVLSPEKRLTRINSMFYGYKEGPLVPSGLLGPVRICSGNR